MSVQDLELSDVDLLADVASREAALSNENAKLLVAVGSLTEQCSASAKVIDDYVKGPGSLSSLKQQAANLRDVANTCAAAFGAQIVREHGNYIHLLEYAHDVLRAFADGKATQQDLSTLMISISCQLSPNSPASKAKAVGRG